MNKVKVLSIAATLLAGLSSLPTIAAEKVSVAVSSTSIFFASTYVAKEMGYFDEAGLDVEIVDVGSGTNVIASVAGGSAQIGMAGIRNVAQGVEKGQDFKIFGSSLKGFPNFLVVQSGFMAGTGVTAESPLNERVATLKGKTIAVNDIGGSAGEFVRELLGRAGLAETDAVLINISSTPGRLAALKGRVVDGLVGYAPEPETAMLEGYGEILIDSSSDIPEIAGIEYITHFTTSAFLTDNRPAAEAYLAAAAKAVKLMNEDPDAARDAFFRQMTAKAEGVETDPALAALQWKNMQPFFSPIMSLTEEGLAGSRGFFRIADGVTNEQLVDNSIAAPLDPGLSP